MKGLIKCICLIINLLVISCSSSVEESWVTTLDGKNKIWVKQSSSDFRYLWDGETFDSLAHGKGTLFIYAADTLYERKEMEAWLGAIEPSSVIQIGEKEHYVGEIKGDEFNGYGVYKKNEDTYIGDFKDSKPSGFLKWYKGKQIYYEGEWEKGVFHGVGIYYKENGTIKAGEWDYGKLTQAEVDFILPNGHYRGYVKNNQPDKHGIMEYADGSFYRGGWKEGKWHGKGLYVSGNDSILTIWAEGQLNGETLIQTPYFSFEGGYFEGYPHGFGSLSVPESLEFVGYFREGERNGYGEIVLKNGDSYKGDWVNGLFQGEGIYTYHQEGATYEGQWYEGLQDGVGYYRSKIFAYKGEWEDGWMNGYGKMVFSNKDEYIGNFVENKFYGEGLYLFHNGDKYEGEFIDGKFNGLGTFTFANGDSYTGEFLNGEIKGDGTLQIIENGKSILITANWPGANMFPSKASIIFSNGDVYEGKLINGNPCMEGKWTTLKDIEKSIPWTDKANDFYKSHKEEFQQITKTVTYVAVVVGVAAAITAATVSVVGTGGATAPAALVLVNSALVTASSKMATINTVLYVANMTANAASGTIDYSNAVTKDEKQQIAKETGINLAIDAAFLLAPKVSKSSAYRAAKVTLSTGIKNIGKKTAIQITKSKVFGKIVTVTKDKAGRFSKSLSRGARKNAKETVNASKRKFESLLLKTLIKRTKLFRTLQEIRAKGPIKLSEKELKALLDNPKYIRSYIETYTNKKGNFLEFFIRLSMGDKKQVKTILDNPYIRKYVDRSIRSSGEGGNHEWLMTKNFKSFLTDSKWGEDGQFLALALTKLVQSTERVIFKNGGRHPSSVAANSSESARFHLRLAEVIESCSSKEELLIKVRQFAKKELAPDSYQEFNKIFMSIFVTDK